MAGTIDYDYDAVINTCTGDILSNVSELETSLNSLCTELATCEDCFHSSVSNGAIPEIYQGFSDCIGNTNANTGLAALIKQIVNIINTSYSEAMRDKNILESSLTNGGSGADGTQTSEGESTNTGSVSAQTAAAEPTPQEIQTLTQDQNPAQGGGIPGALSPGTSGTTFPAQAYNLSPEEYKVLCATVYAEAAEGNSYTTSDTMGVTSVILNRVEAGNWGGSDVVSVVSAKGQFSGYGEQNQKFAAAMNNPSIISPEMRAAIDRTLAGERNTRGQSFSGNGTHNSFR